MSQKSNLIFSCFQHLGFFITWTFYIHGLDYLNRSKPVFSVAIKLMLNKSKRNWHSPTFKDRISDRNNFILRAKSPHVYHFIWCIIVVTILQWFSSFSGLSMLNVSIFGERCPDNVKSLHYNWYLFLSIWWYYIFNIKSYTCDDAKKTKIETTILSISDVPFVKWLQMHKRLVFVALFVVGTNTFSWWLIYRICV